MSDTTVADYLVYVNLQMAAESTQIPDGYSGAIDPAWLANGNDRSSKTPALIAEQIANDWRIASHIKNEDTGLSATLFKSASGEFVLSIRSTEFIDDAVRDSKATNELEIKDTGFAIGQLADLEKWYQETVKSMVGASAITVTGYSLGGHVATAFEQLHRGDGAVAQVFNFNGAGVGSVKEGHRLADVLAEFDKYRSDDKDLSYMFTTPEALKLYQEVRATLGAHQRLTDAQVAQAKSLGQSFAIGDQTYAPAADALLLSQAIARIKDVQDYAAYVDKVKDPKPPSKDGLTLDVIEQDDINYQIGILKAADLTQPMSIFRQVVNLPFNHGPRSEQRDNIFDVTGATHWSAVANSQYHHGRNTQIYIENQPLVRGDFVEEMAQASEWLHADIKLLVDNFSTNSFGDTHSLVLLQDSLSVQGLMARLDESFDLSAGTQVLRAASNAQAASVEGEQGKADGDTLERAVDALSRIFIGPGYEAIKDLMPPASSNEPPRDRNEGGTWANPNDRNQNLHAVLSQLTEATKALDGQLKLSVADRGLASAAKADFGALVTLLAGSTVAVTGDGADGQEALEQALAKPTAWDEEHAAWLADKDLNPEERSAGLANFSDQYLQDRAAYVRALVQRNLNDRVDGDTVLDQSNLSFMAEDLATSTTITSAKDLRSEPSFNVVFGTSEDDPDVNGSDAEDHLYGGSGDDVVSGGDSSDWLEGQAGDDELEGGDGNDQLFGGSGNDTYNFDDGHGADTVVDNGDDGSISYGGALIERARCAGNNTWVTKTASGELLRLTLVDDSRSITGQSLLISGLNDDGDEVRIRNFDLQAAQDGRGYLGIKLDIDRALVVVSNQAQAGLAAQADSDNNPFAPERAWDFDPGAVQAVNGEAPERAGENFTIYLNQGAQAGDTLKLKIEGASGKLKLVANGEVIDFTGEAVVTLEEGQTELGFALLGADAIDADKSFTVTATWQPAGSGPGAMDDDPADSNAINYTLKDGGPNVNTYLGDQLGPNYSDVLVGGELVDHIQGLGGNDALNGAAGNDWIEGGLGDDLIGGGQGSDYIQGGTGNDMILTAVALAVGNQGWQPPDGKEVWIRGDRWGVYDNGDQTYIIDGAGPMPHDDAPDIVEAGEGDDRVIGGRGDDILLGEDGNDDLTGIDGNDALSGGLGNDTLGGDGTDTVCYYVTVAGDQHGVDVIDGGAGDDSLYGNGNVDYLDGGEGNDFMRGDQSNWAHDEDGLAGEYHGDDELDGGLGDDSMIGDGGNDLLRGGDGGDYMLGDDVYEADLPPVDPEAHGSDTLEGGTGDDLLHGSGEADWLFGDEGNDVIRGDADDDDLSAEYHGDDWLEGGAGADSMSGDAGNDWVFGGEDGDLMLGDADDIEDIDHGDDTLDGGEGNDTIEGQGGADTLVGGDGNDDMHGDGAAIGGEFQLADSLEGNAGDDTLTGGGHDDSLYGGEGDDDLWGDDVALGQEFHGADWLDGGEGDDTIQGHAGDDSVFGGEGDDVVAGGDETSPDGASTMGGDDAVFGEAGDDVVLGGLGNDTLSGGDGDDVLGGGEGHDVLEGGMGSDTMMGGKGNDDYFVDAVGLTLGVPEVISDKEGQNNIYIRGSATQVSQADGNLTITFGEGQSLFIEGGLEGGVSEIYFVGQDSGSEAAPAGNEAAANDATGFVEWLQLNFWESVSLTADSSTTALYGGSGNDTLAAGADAIVLNGGWGDDTYTVKALNQTVVEYDHGGVDKVMSDVSFTLGLAIEELTLSSAAGSLSEARGNELGNTLTGNSLANKLYGYGGNDTLNGGVGNDTMDGGVGDDTYVLNVTSDDVNEAIGEGRDTLQYSGSSSFTLNRSNHGEVENLILTGTYNNAANGNDLGNALTGGSGANTLNGYEGNDTLDGGLGADMLVGGKGDDTLVMNVVGDNVTELAGEGNDTVQIGFEATVDLNLAKYANIENATLLEAAGAQGLTGTAGDNVLIGNTSINTLAGNDGADTLIGGGGEDMLSGGAGDDTYFVDSAGDQVIEAADGGTDTVLTVVDWTLGDTTENLTLLGAVWADATGNALVNTLTGNDGANVLDGKAGNDMLIGGLGDDTFRMDTTDDMVVELVDGGIDTIEIADSLSLVDRANVENLALQGSGDFWGTGNAAHNVLIGNSGRNTLQGGAGSDTLDGGVGVDALSGGVGDDTYVIDDTGDVVTELANEGTDTVQSTITITSLGTELENAVLLGSANISAMGNNNNNRLTGNSSVNTLTGGGGADTLDGAGGADTLKGGAGNDVYLVNDAAAKVQESSGQGTDTVETSVTLIGALAANVENLTLTGAAAINATGNGLANTIVGNSAANVIDGGAGADVLRGGAGDDSYVLDEAGDTVIEAEGEGIDSVKVAATWVLSANIENATLDGSGSFSLTGNGLANRLVGNAQANTISGGDGHDTLNGGADTLADQLVGGAGDDVYELAATGDVVVEAAAGGWDTVLMGYSGTLHDNVEALQLTGIKNLTGTGNTEANRITGNDGNNTLKGMAGNDTLFGGLGEDKLIGGLGDDLFVLNSAGDTVTETSEQGRDVVQSSVSVNLSTLSDHVEDVVLTGSEALNATGNAAANALYGNDAANRLNGGAGDDLMAGGDGDDTYVRDSQGDQIIEAYGSGNDTVESAISTSLVDLAAVENLTLTGAATQGTGNRLNNRITGNDLANTLDGGEGADTLSGGNGSDVLQGGAGNDTYVIGAETGLAQQRRRAFDEAWAEDVVYRGVHGGGFGAAGRFGHGFAGVWRGWPVGGFGRGPFMALDQLAPAAADTIVEAADGGIDTVEASVSVSALTDHVENLTLTGTANLSGTGNGLGNNLVGNSGNNVLTGLAGNDTLDGGGASTKDTLVGGLGDDTYVLHTDKDVITELAGEGIDTAMAGFNAKLADNVERLILTGTGHLQGTGNGSDNEMVGNDGNNRLDGGAGNDLMRGGAGDDIYVLAAGDSIVELAGQGIDTAEANFHISLADHANVENATLRGSSNLRATGTSEANQLTGNTGANQLFGGEGNDTLDGGLGGNDVLDGGSGDDTYVLRGAGDTLVEAAGGGSDTLRSDQSVALAQFTNIENITLTGSAAADATGDAAINVLIGNTAANILDGGAGADSMTGGAGDDTYVLDVTNDRVTELAGEGTDTVMVGFSSNLTNPGFANVENMTLTGTDNYIAIGSSGDNVLTGNAGANQLSGAEGNDLLIGRSGNDTLFGGAGNDELVDDAGVLDNLLGEAGADVYRIGATSAPGTTRTVKVHGGGDGDVIYLDAGILPEHVTKRVVDGSTSLFLEIRSPGVDLQSFTIELVNQYAADGSGQVSEVRFVSAPEVVWSGAELNGFRQIGTAGSDSLTGSTPPDLLDGLAGDDRLYGHGGDDTLIGGSGSDRMYGHDGNDAFEVDLADGRDLVVGDSGNDTLRIIGGVAPTSVSLFRVSQGYGGTYGYAEDTLVVRNAATGAEVWLEKYFQLDGSAAVESITFSDGTVWAISDVLARVGPSATADTMTGSSGDDNFVVDHYLDVVNDSNLYDRDTVSSSISFTMPDTIERLELTGELNLTAIGTDSPEEIIGNAGHNLIDGGFGADSVAGGAGNDTYIDRARTGGYTMLDTDQIVEASGGGHDVVYTNGPYRTLAANVEDLVVTSDALFMEDDWTGLRYDREFTGNELDNFIRVEVSDGVRSFVDGGAGADTLVGANGTEVFTVDSYGDRFEDSTDGDGDAVSTTLAYTLGDHIEGLILTGSQAVSGTGNVMGNRLDGSGNAAANQLRGLQGNDVYVLGSGDQAIEAVDEGHDTVELTSGSFVNAGVLSIDAFANVEGLSAVFETNSALTIVGNDGANTLAGPEGLSETVLEGRGGDDILIDHSRLMSMDTLLGGTGNDTLVSDGGEDWLDGGAGEDLYRLSYQVHEGTPMHAGQQIRLGHGSGRDTVEYLGEVSWEWSQLQSSYLDPKVHGYVAVQESMSNRDDLLAQRSMVVNLDGDVDASTLQVTRSGEDLTIALNAGSELLIRDFFENSSSNHVVSPIDCVLFGGAFITGDQMAKAVGLNNFSSPTSGDDLLIATLGSPATQMAGDGDDYLAGGLGAQSQDGGLGHDTLVAGDGDDTLTGGGGDDMLCGGRGADRYVFSAGWGQDVLNEADLLGFGLGSGSTRLNPDGAANVIAFDASVSAANLQLEWVSGEGLYIRNQATGDTIFVAGDSKTPDGADPGANSEAYVDRIEFADGTVWSRAAIEWGGRVVEGTEGADVLQDSVDQTLVLGHGGNDTLTANFINTHLYGGAGNDRLTTRATSDNGEQAHLFGGDGNDTLVGAATDDTLDGGAGADSMSGGAGSDCYVFDNVLDVVTEGTDSNFHYDYLLASVTVSTLATNVEGVRLAEGAGAIGAAGNIGDNQLEGNEFGNSLAGGAGRDTLWAGDGDDVLDGGTGNDILEGGYGADTYVFNASTYGTDTVSDVSDGSPTERDRLNFGAYKRGDVTISRVVGTDNLQIQINGSSSKVIIQSWYQGAEYQIEDLVFADGIIRSDEIQSLMAGEPRRGIGDVEVNGEDLGGRVLSLANPRRGIGDSHATSTEGRAGALMAHRLVEAMSLFAQAEGESAGELIRPRAMTTSPMAELSCAALL